jgi:L-fuculose-phosphate aldolase
MPRGMAEANALVQSMLRMAKTENELRRDIVEIGRLIYQKGWVAANDGNISVRLDQDRVLCTPTGVSKGLMHPDDLIVCDGKGNKLYGVKERTSEIAMHLLIYQLRPEIRSVVHAHPPVATGFAAAGKALDLALLPEVIISMGCVPLAGYGLPGTPELLEPMKPLIGKYDALLMANHGAVCYGEDHWKAFFRMETVEHYARIALVAHLLGGASVLPKAEVDKLLDSRSRYGVTVKSGGAPGCPVVAEDVAGGGKFVVTREELIALVEEALRARGIA